MTVRIRTLHPGDEPHVEALLLAHSDRSLFLRRNLMVTGLVDRGDRYHGTWAGAFEHGRLIAVAQHTRFGSVLVQAPAHVGAVVHEAVRVSDRPIGGFVGPWEQAIAARTALNLDDAPMRVDSHEGLYALALDSLVVPSPLARGAWRCRPARGDDMPMLVAWRIGFNVETNGETDGPELRVTSQEEIASGLADGAGWLLEVDGAPVAYQQFNAMLPDVVQVGGVWTPPALRNRGYARAVVAGALLAARANGARRGVLFTGENNHAAQRAYAALGFSRIGDWGLLFFKAPARMRVP